MTNPLSNDSDFTNSMRDALKIQIPCIILIKRKRISLCGVVVSVSGTAKPSPIFWDQKSNFVYITKCASYPKLHVNRGINGPRKLFSISFFQNFPVPQFGLCGEALIEVYLSSSNFTNTTTSLNISRISSDIPTKVCTLLTFTKLLLTSVRIRIYIFEV